LIGIENHHGCGDVVLHFVVESEYTYEGILRSNSCKDKLQLRAKAELLHVFLPGWKRRLSNARSMNDGRRGELKRWLSLRLCRVEILDRIGNDRENVHRGLRIEKFRLR